MWSLLPLTSVVRSKVLRKPSPALQEVALRKRVISPGGERRTKPALALEGQLDRVTGWVFRDEAGQRRSLAGETVNDAPTVAYELRDGVLLDGVLYKGSATRHLHGRTKRVPTLKVETTLDRASSYCSWNGHRWFGLWPADDCAAYLLAEKEAEPFTSARPGAPKGHQREYEERLGMRPRRESAAWIRRAVFFDDVGHNESKRARIVEMRERLLGGTSARRHPGVFLLRGTAGDLRLLRNELEIAELAASELGLRVLDPLKSSVDQIVRACAGASVLMGVEGSGLMHGMPLLDEGAHYFVLQPPDRFCTVYKDYADRDGHGFAYVVGKPEGEGFVVDPDEVRRTFDLIAKDRVGAAGG